MTYMIYNTSIDYFPSRPPEKKTRHTDGSYDKFDTGLSLNDDEAIALKLLQS